MQTGGAHWGFANITTYLTLEWAFEIKTPTKKFNLVCQCLRNEKCNKKEEFF